MLGWGDTVEQGLALLPHSKKVAGSRPPWSWVWDLSVWSLHVLPVSAWVLSGFSGFLPQSKNMHVRSIGDSKLSLGVNVSVNGCVSLCGPAMNWRLIQGVTLPSPQDSWDRLQLTPVTLRSGLSGSRK